MPRYYVTAVVVVDAPNAQAAVDAVHAAVALDLEGEPILEVHVDDGDEPRPVDPATWTLLGVTATD